MGVTVARHAGLPAGRRWVLVVAFLLVGGYVAEEFRFGNAHFFVIALLVFAYDRAEAGRILTPAAALAVAIATKITPLALLVYFAWRRRYALCATTCALLGLLIVLPAGILGPAGNARQLRAFATYAVERIDEGDNYPLRGALMRYLAADPGGPTHISASVANSSPATVNGLWIIGLCGLGLAGLAAMWRDDPDPVVRALEFSIVLTSIVLASPHTQRRYFVTLYVPAVLLAALLARTPQARERRAILAGLLAIAAPASILPLVFGNRRLALIYEAGSPYFRHACAVGRTGRSDHSPQGDKPTTFWNSLSPVVGAGTEEPRRTRPARYTARAAAGPLRASITGPAIVRATDE